jgi:hypothetical protein
MVWGRSSLHAGLFGMRARDQMVENITKGDFEGVDPPESI